MISDTMTAMLATLYDSISVQFEKRSVSEETPTAIGGFGVPTKDFPVSPRRDAARFNDAVRAWSEQDAFDMLQIAARSFLRYRLSMREIIFWRLEPMIDERVDHETKEKYYIAQMRFAIL